MKKVIKVVRSSRGKYYSATPLGRVLEYKIGRERRPRKGDGPLATFRSLRDAVQFVENNNFHGPFAFFDATCKPSKECCLSFLQSGQRQWTGPLPHGTVLADSVTLVKRLELK